MFITPSAPLLPLNVLECENIMCGEIYVVRFNTQGGTLYSDTGESEPVLEYRVGLLHQRVFILIVIIQPTLWQIW